MLNKLREDASMSYISIKGKGYGKTVYFLNYLFL